MPHSSRSRHHRHPHHGLVSRLSVLASLGSSIEFLPLSEKMRFLWWSSIDLPFVVAFFVALIVLVRVAKPICCHDEESLDGFGLAFVGLPLMFGLFGSNAGSLPVGVAVGSLVSLFLTTFFGNLGLKTSLLLALATASTIAVATLAANQFMPAS